MDKLKLMKSFVAVVRAGSFLSAARDINASRSLLSKHVNQLETNLGVQLLNRDTHSMSLTETGTEYFDFCVQFLSELEEVEAAITERARRPQGTLRILAPLYFGGRFLGSAIADFSNIYPDLNVSINLWGQALQSSDVVGRSYDIVIRTIPPVDSNLRVRKVAPIRNVVCASPDYLRLHGEPDTPSDLSKHPCMYHRKDSDYRWRFTGPEGNISVRLPAAKMPRTNSVEILRHMVLGGRGIGILAEYAVYEDLAAGTLTELLPAYEAEARGLFLLFPDAQFSPLKVRLFVDFFVERYGTAPWDTLQSENSKLPAELL
jgi:DNA-binding transcriptional LysR family regulator